MSDELAECECLLRSTATEAGAVIEGHVYELTERHEGCTVDVMVCLQCGHQTITWFKPGQPPVMATYTGEV